MAWTFTVSGVEARQRQPGMLEGLSRFLVQHERCGAGFDVAHPAGLGSGRVSITCRGCGARHEYATATIEVERELRVEPAHPPEPQESAREIPPRPAPYPDSERRAEAPAPADQAPSAEPAREAKSAEEVLRAHAAKTEAAARRRGSRRPEIAAGRSPAGESRISRFGRSPGVILAILIASAVALGFGVVTLVNEIGSDDPSTEPVTALPPAATAPEPSPDPVPAPPEPPAPSPVPGAPQPAVTTLRTDRFTVDVPRRWSRRTVDGGLLLQPRGGGRVRVRIFYERSPDLSAARMARQTREFMARRVPGARLLPNQIELAGGTAFELTARGPGETAIAVNVLRGPYRFLIVRRIFAGAKPQTSEAASRIVRSFRPS